MPDRKQESRFYKFCSNQHVVYRMPLGDPGSDGAMTRATVLSFLFAFLGKTNMHLLFRKGFGIAAVLMLAPFAEANTRDPAADLAVMRTLPIYLITPAVPLRPTMPLSMTETAGTRAFGTYGRFIGGANRSPVGLLATFKWVKARAINLAVPGLRTLRAAGCLVDDSAVNAQAIEATLDATQGFADMPVTRVESDKQIPVNTPRIVMVATSSITPDYAAIITTYGVEVYAPQMPNAPSKWKAQPSLAYNFAIVSDSIEPPTLAPNGKTDNEPALPVEPKDKQDDGSSGTWPLAITAAQRAKVWAENKCARVNAALDGNRSEAGRLLALSLNGQMPTNLPDDWGKTGFMSGIPPRNLPTDAAEAMQRHLYADGNWVVVSRRAGDNVMIDFRFTWLPNDTEAIYDKMHPAARN
jgi:hypothetical protein